MHGPISEDPDVSSDLTHVHWGEIARHLEPGDEVRIRIVAADKADDPIETPQLERIDDEDANGEAEGDADGEAEGEAEVEAA